MGLIHREHRHVWRERRRDLEQNLNRMRRRSTPDGERHHRFWLAPVLEVAITAAFQFSGLYRAGRRNALDIRLSELEFRFADLPAEFDGYRIVHLSDLHVGTVPGLTEALLPLLARMDAELVVLTGDYQTFGAPEPDRAGALLAPVIQACRAADGIYGVLGNHDRAAMVDVLERLGVRMLVNETTCLERNGARIHLVGLDDIHCFYTPAARTARAARGDGFHLLLAHSVELAHEAERLGFALLLSGHTHGGQICLPGGTPVMTALDRHQRLAKGAWRLGALQGYTSSGTGSSVPPLRLNSRPEVAVVTLRRG